MKARLGILAVVSVGVGLFVWQVSFVSPAHAGPEISVATAAAVLPALPGDEPAYIGSKKCKACHKAQYTSWEEGRKAKSMDTLMPGKFAEAKTAHNLDPAKDYTKDESCLKCHTTGYGHEGGYAIPDAADEKAVKQAKNLEGVGCESCHGPGSAYKDLHKDIKKEKRTYKFEEMVKAGQWKIEQAKCEQCHNEKSPTFKGFDFEKQKMDSSHTHEPLKQREG